MTTATTAEDALHFRGETLTPESPRPVHFAEPHSIPVLENQIDPKFNDTASHEDTLDAKGDELPNIASEVEDPAHLTKQLFSRTIELFRNGTNALGSGASGDQQDIAYLPSGPGCGDTGFGMSSMPVDNVKGNATDLFASSLPGEGQPEPVPNGAPSFPPDYNSLSSSLPSDTPSLTASHTPTGHNQPPAEPDASNSTRAESTANDQAAEKSGGDCDGEVNFQNLLDNLSQPTTTALHMSSNSTATLSPVHDTTATPMIESSLPSGLPPRPPPQEKPSIHPNYLPTDDIRSFHPASAQNPSHYPASSIHQPAALSPIIESSVAAAAAPGTTLVPSELPPPPVAAFQQSLPGLSPPAAKAFQNGKQDKAPKESHLERGDEAPWPPEIQKKYDEFLQQERVHVTEGLWDRFPQGSRLFVGNLPSERVTKRDLFHLFHKYGTLAQISIKQAYGFIQFAEASSCHKALEAEQGGILRGRKIHLEISKPQRNTRPAPSESQRAPVRRSRSPDYDRGSRRSSFDRPELGRPQFSDFRERDQRDRPERRRGDYRSVRSPSPRAARRRSRDRSIERDRRCRRRSRSPYARERYRTPSPRGARGRDRMNDLDLPIPKRSPRSVPDVQLIVLENVDREFVYRVERAFRDRGLRSDVIFLSPRIDLAAVINRQIIEGVLAIAKISRSSQYSGKIPLQVFDHSHGVNDVRFNEYSELDVNVAVDVVLRSRGAPSPNAAAQPQPLAAHPPPQQSQNSTALLSGPNNFANLISALDGPTLQSLLGALQQQQQAPAPAPAPAPQPYGIPNPNPTDLASLLASANRTNAPVSSLPTLNHPGFLSQPSGQPTHNPPFAGDPNLASLLAKGLGGQGQSQPSQHNPHLQNIMGQLSKWRQ